MTYETWIFFVNVKGNYENFCDIFFAKLKSFVPGKAYPKCFSDTPLWVVNNFSEQIINCFGMPLIVEFWKKNGLSVRNIVKPKFSKKQRIFILPKLSFEYFEPHGRANLAF